MTNAEWFNNATKELQAQGFPRTEAHTAARLLLDWTTGTRHAHLLQPESPLEPGKLEKLQRDFGEVLARRPLAYILGQKEFFGRVFHCDERALIPRPETELLVETALERLTGLENPQLADLGTGTGCIAITMALELPSAQVFATDLSPGARNLAATNAELLGAVITILEGNAENWAAPVQPFAPLDAILSNPPYIAQAELPELQPEIREYEPMLALDGGEDGLNPYHLMAKQCQAVLRPGGFLAAELGAGQWPDVAAVFRAEGWEVEPALRDLAGIERVIVARIQM